MNKGTDVAESTLDDARAPEVRAGDLLGPYTVVRFIARGGMGVVWAARLTGTRGFTKTYALKTMLPSLAEEPDYVKVFLDEANVAATLHHPNVCQIFDFGSERGILYIAMEWVEGASLAALLKEHPDAALPLGVAVRIAADACAGLSSVHEAKDHRGNTRNVVHRDVTPQNILLTTDGHAKLADFGVARFAEQAHKRTVTGVVKGKAAYMAPEQLFTAKFDHRCDIFSLGCVLYEATTGRRPFEGRDVATIMRNVARGDFRAPSEVRKGYPPELEAIVIKALAHAPEARFSDARSMRKALEDWLLGAQPPTGHADVAAELKRTLGDSIARQREELRVSSRQIPHAAVAYPAARDSKPDGAGAPTAPEKTPEGSPGGASAPSAPKVPQAPAGAAAAARVGPSPPLVAVALAAAIAILLYVIFR